MNMLLYRQVWLTFLVFSQWFHKNVRENNRKFFYIQAEGIFFLQKCQVFRDKDISDTQELKREKVQKHIGHEFHDLNKDKNRLV